jgi:DNA-binding CsgD family transcriptional regulator
MHKPTDSLPPAVLAQMADALMWPLLVLRVDGTLLHANRAARRLLSAKHRLKLLPDRHLGLLPADRQAEWQAALLAAGGGQSVVLSWPASGGSLAVVGSLSPLDDPWSAALGGEALLLALSCGEQPDAQVQAYARLHRLSPAETRVLQRLALGESSGEAADALGVSAATVRSQIISLRRKTGDASVTDLLRSLARMPPVNPLVSLGAQGE